MRDPFQKRPGAAFVAALGFVLFCLLASSLLDQPHVAPATASTEEWR
jgi:hypothetical protein